MPDLTLKDGREITFDLDAISLKEHRALFDVRQPQDDEDAFACKVSGLELDEYLGLSMADQKRFWKAYFKRVREPLEDPN